MKTSAFVVVLALALTIHIGAQKKKDVPETVHVTYQAKAGSEAALERAIARQWTAGRRLKLFNPVPHVVVRGTEDGKTFFVEIVEWRDENIPDQSPQEIQDIWKDMRGLTEQRNGRPGIQFVQVALIR